MLSLSCDLPHFTAVHKSSPMALCKVSMRCALQKKSFCLLYSREVCDFGCSHDSKPHAVINSLFHSIYMKWPYSVYGIYSLFLCHKRFLYNFPAAPEWLGGKRLLLWMVFTTRWYSYRVILTSKTPWCWIIYEQFNQSESWRWSAILFYHFLAFIQHIKQVMKRRCHHTLKTLSSITKLLHIKRNKM